MTTLVFLHDIVHVHEPHLTKHLNWCGELFLTDLLIFLFLCGSFETLPRQAGTIEVHQHITHALHIVTTTEIKNLRQKKSNRISANPLSKLEQTAPYVCTGFWPSLVKFEGDFRQGRHVAHLK